MPGLFVLIAFSLVALSDGRDSDADCDRFFDEFCCNKKCVDGTSDCCSKDSDCFEGESCCNYKCKLDCDDGDNSNITYIALGVAVHFHHLVSFLFSVLLSREAASPGVSSTNRRGRRDYCTAQLKQHGIRSTTVLPTRLPISSSPIYPFHYSSSPFLTIRIKEFNVYGMHKLEVFKGKLC